MLQSVTKQWIRDSLEAGGGQGETWEMQLDRLIED